MSFTMSLVCSISSAVAAIASAITASRNFNMQKAIKKRQEKLEQEKRKEFECNVFKLCRYTDHLLKTIEGTEGTEKPGQNSQKVREDYNCVMKTIKILSLGPTQSAASFKEADLITEIKIEMPNLTYTSYVADFRVEIINTEDLNNWCTNTIKKIKNNFDFIK